MGAEYRAFFEKLNDEHYKILEEELENVNTSLKLKKGKIGEMVEIQVWFDNDKEHLDYVSRLFKRGLNPQGDSND